MAVRANWKGYLKLSLVSCKVALYPATSSSSRVRFHTLNRETGAKVKRQYIDPTTEAPVESHDQIKGFQVGKGSFIHVEDEELEAIRIESTHTIEISSFVPREQIDTRYFEVPYYIAPEDPIGVEAFAVIRDAMREKGQAALARVVIARRERIVLLEPLGKGIMATVLRYANEVRDEAPYFEDIPDIDLPAETRQLAAHIVDTRAGEFEPAKFEDRYENAVLNLIKSKQAGEPVVAPAAPPPTTVVNLMDALRRSIAVEKAELKKAPSKANPQPAAKKAGKPRTTSRKAG